MAEDRQIVIEIFRAAIRAVDGRRCVRETLQGSTADNNWVLAALGKAACAMTRGALDVLGSGMDTGLVVTKSGYGERSLAEDSRIRILEAGHPVPDAMSLAAGDELIRMLEDATSEQRLLILISGGASSLVEVPRAGVTLSDLRRLNRWLLGSGLDIERANAIRKAVSTLKGGRLLRYCGHHKTTGLLISDVPGDDPAIIGSGLLTPAATAAPNEGLPEWVSELINVPADLVVGDRGENLTLHVIAGPEDALDGAARCAKSMGYRVELKDYRLVGEASAMARRIAKELDSGPPGIHLWVGETTVTLPKNPGCGGRNQHLALSVAQQLVGRDDFVLLAAGTDGTDGPGEFAGAIVDGATMDRGMTAGLNVAACIRAADSGRFLEASGDLFWTGPTGTNVADIVIALKAGVSPR